MFKDNRQRLLYRMSDVDRKMYEEYREIDRKQEEMLDDLFEFGPRRNGQTGKTI